MNILVTGGSGYIGSHACVALLAAGHAVTVVDDLSNSRPEVLDRVARIAGRRPVFFEGDVRDRALLRRVFAASPIDAVIHFAGLKAVGESVAQPLRYYDCNVGGAIVLCEVMSECAVKTLIFSSSATVYGDPASVPIREDFPRSATNPYGASKLMIEDILADLAQADREWRIARLRYFNPVGAHASGLIGEEPNGIPNNLLPYVAQVAAGKRQQLSVFGNDYPTPDGTGVRDYIHVMDLVEGHLAALDYLLDKGGLLTVNLGTGCGYSVLDMVRAFETASGCPVPYALVPRRPGDIAACYADPALAEALLGWQARRGIEEMCSDAWRWQQQCAST
ncbi:MAG: UDP-glucose 4-epimerase [Candidatus Accumulibacter regalis]|jgi:UDP-glucose 4-epimerase|uniref:UDP-glucose 4-epimerase n=1 Tax=Accumulibacter regalis TaxID=522306 RepID=A0A011QJB4_ACCRE|nr:MULTISPECIES: UDP-glucose 4-epimerase GalE [unclassified Candidatus Accumulibacter]EXI89447.1 MAG: UDP-glucose 4-epimerase [Candidatus Accumulibacter regalis]MQM35795.1 UDP-glucose 4-epimerase GalE [Candidatus Accumulibacter phosphatis]MBL8366927.1 UDP-glucose 4-epimerase GalE [Accumulibacter sp.]MBN8514270.1 UDP-glucose 4-epimerase GalE [Accumulibacter sp.]HRE70923.1 UDP-glucose 4-epimerase GalE [Accumulibacter sp.]